MHAFLKILIMKYKRIMEGSISLKIFFEWQKRTYFEVIFSISAKKKVIFFEYCVSFTFSTWYIFVGKVAVLLIKRVK